MYEPRADNIRLSVEDSRDYWYSPIVTGNPPPAEIDLDEKLFAVPDQAREGACLSFATVGECQDIELGEELSEQFPYFQMRKAEGRIGQSGGSMRDMFDVCRKIGVPLESKWRYLPENENTEPSAEAYADAATRKIERFETLYFRPWHGIEYIDLFKRCLAENNRIIFAAPVTREYSRVTGDWRQHSFAGYANGGQMLGFHGQRLVGCSDAAQRWLIRGSWGPNVGDGGYFGLPYAYTNDIIEARIIRLFAGKGRLRQPGIYCTRNDRTGISAQIVPTEQEDRKPTKVWVAGLMGGKFYLKGSDGNVRPYDGTLPPTIETTFDGALDIDVGDGDFSSLTGADIWVAYGDNPVTWKPKKICTI